MRSQPCGHLTAILVPGARLALGEVSGNGQMSLGAQLVKAELSGGRAWELQ